ncbi:MAG: tetratricopeptide repeat protein [Promethearchaeota archaeon]|jgi:tetratricopeptide (TPR) repeat protein
MPESVPKDLRYAENLRREGKFQEALKIINDIEKKGPLTPRDQLTLLISKGKILIMYQRYGETASVGKAAYRLSQTLGKKNEIITSLLFKSSCLFLGQYDKALEYLFEAEKLLNSLSDVSPSYLTRQKKNILFRKSWAYIFKGEVNQALDEALECLELQEKYGFTGDIAHTLQVIGNAYMGKGDYDLALDYASRSLKKFEETGDHVGVGTVLNLLGSIYFWEGDYNQALNYYKQSLSIKTISNRVKADNLHLLGQVYFNRGEIDKALKYFKRGIDLTENENIYDLFINFQIAIGTVYVLKGEYDLALEFLEPSLSLAEKINDAVGIANSLIYLGTVYYEKNAIEQSQRILEKIEKLSTQWGTKLYSNIYLLAKARFLIKTGGSRDRVEAEKLLKQVYTEETQPTVNANALIYLCEFYLEELTLFENTEVLRELNPLVEQLYTLSEDQRMYGTLAEAKLLQAKVALIQLNFEDTQRLLTQAQRVAELYGLNRLAQKISSEHDNYLEKLSDWKNLKEREAPISERLKLASVDDVLERLQGKREIKPPELVEEEPIVLLIIDKTGISYFNHSFIENWDFEWLFSSFMSAFETFSSEVFSESIDRIKIGENLILINPIESFLVCYVIKGQSYPGLQKLNRFSEAIKNNTEIWESLNRAVKTGEALELDKPQSLGNVVNEIFIH